MESHCVSVCVCVRVGSIFTLYSLSVYTNTITVMFIHVQCMRGNQPRRIGNTELTVVAQCSICIFLTLYSRFVLKVYIHMRTLSTYACYSSRGAKTNVLYVTVRLLHNQNQSRHISTPKSHPPHPPISHTKPSTPDPRAC